jgi:hypothetical protein
MLPEAMTRNAPLLVAVNPDVDDMVTSPDAATISADFPAAVAVICDELTVPRLIPVLDNTLTLPALEVTLA